MKKTSENYLMLLKKGYSYQEIGDMFNFSKQYIWMKIKQDYSKEEIEKAVSKEWKRGKRRNKKYIKKPLCICQYCGKEFISPYYFKKKFCFGTDCKNKFFSEQMKKIWQKKEK